MWAEIQERVGRGVSPPPRLALPDEQAGERGHRENVKKLVHASRGESRYVHESLKGRSVYPGIYLDGAG